MKLFLFVSFLFLSGLSVLAQELNFQSTPKPGDKFCILTYRDPIEFEAYTKEFYQLENGFENKKGIDSIVVYHSSDFGEIVIEGDIKHLLEEQINLPIKGNTIYVVKRPSKKKASEISMVKFNVIRQKKGSNELKFKVYMQCKYYY
ncbi:MAG: hypothetical protein R2728_01840 [Chitinophagales bacterium]